MARHGDTYDFGPFEDDYRGFDIRDDETGRGPLILALAVGVLLIFGAVVWNTYRQGVRSPDSGDVPMITADLEPYKRAPANAGGAQAPFQDKTVYDQMDGSQRDTAPVQALPANALQTADLPPLPSNESLSGGPPLDLRPALDDDNDPETGMPNAVADQVRALSNLNNVPSDEEPTAQVASLGNVAMPTTPPPPALIVDEPEPQTYANFNFAENGQFMVQVAAFRSQDAAEAAWNKSVANKPALYNGSRKFVQRADLGAKGVFFKAPKPGQDRRIDLPTLGPQTVARAAAAGLAGIAWQAGGVILLNRAEMMAAAMAAGLFLWARPA